MRALRLAAVALFCLRALAAGDPPAADLSGRPWASWFEKSVQASDKKSYVHFLWDAFAVRKELEGAGKRAFVAEAGRQLARLRYPRGATADAIKADVVFITQRDEYGNPKWDSIQRIAHLEFSRRRVLEAPAGADPSRAFDKFEIAK